MKQVLFCTIAPAPTGTNYSALYGGTGTWSSVESSARTPWSAPGVFRNLVVELVTAPGAGTSRTFTLRNNGAGTALTVTISDTATTARLTGIDVSIAAGDLVAIQHTVSGSPAVAPGIRWSLEFEGSTADQSGYCGVLGTISTAVGNRYGGVFNQSGTAQAAGADARQIVAAAGTLTRTDAIFSAAPGVGNGVTFYINKNGTRQDGSGGTVNTACVLIGAITQASATYSLSLAAGDIVYTEGIVSGSFSPRTFALGTAFTATTAGQSQLVGATTGQIVSNSATNYWPVAAIGAAVNATEATFGVQAIPGVTSIRLSGLRVLLSVAPGSGKSRLVDLRNASTSPGPTVTISDTATTASDLTNSGIIVDGSDRWNLRTTPTGTPATTLIFWSFIQEVATGVVTGATIASAAQLFAGTVEAPALVEGATVASTATVTPGTVTVSPPGRISQIPVETLLQYDPAVLPARTSQIPVELLHQYTSAVLPARVSQIAVELIHQYTPSVLPARTTQAALEIIYPFGCYTYEPVAVCPIEFAIDADLAEQDCGVDFPIDAD